MKRLYKITILFFIIFLIGIYISIKSINNYFTSEDEIETISVIPNTTNNASQVLVINFINN